MSSISLKALEDGVRETLTYAIHADALAETQSKLIDIYRKIRLSRLLDEEEFVSIGGTQGAGKTTFLITLNILQNYPIHPNTSLTLSSNLFNDLR